MKTRLAAALQKIIKRAGTPIRVRYFTLGHGSVYDDDTTLAQSGNDLWTSGVVLPISTGIGGADSLLIEQGKVLHNDTKLFLHGSLLLTGSEMQVKIKIGSPSGDEYSIIPPGPIKVSAQGEPIYKKGFVRRIAGVGSLLGE